MTYLQEGKGEENGASNELEPLKTVLLAKASYKPNGSQDIEMNPVVI